MATGLLFVVAGLVSLLLAPLVGSRIERRWATGESVTWQAIQLGGDRVDYLLLGAALLMIGGLLAFFSTRRRPLPGDH